MPDVTVPITNEVAIMADDLLSRGECRAIHVFKALTDIGWRQDRVSGSHHIFTRAGCSCIPVAVHGSKVRRDVAYHILRRASIQPHEVLQDADTLPADEPGMHAPREDMPSPPATNRALPAERVWAETSEAERAEHQLRETRAADDRRRDREAFELLLRDVQRSMLDGEYEAVHTRLSPMLGVHIEEAALDRLTELVGYELIGDALFFFSTASGYLATSDGEAGFASSEHQQIVVNTFAVCKRLLERFREKRAEARLLLQSLLSRVHTLYLSRLMDLAMAQAIEEFGADQLISHMSKMLSGSDVRQLRAASVECMPGDRVQISGLQSKPELNGLAASVLGYNTAKERYEVRIDGASAPMLLKRANLILPDDGSEDGGEDDEDEGANTVTPLQGNLSEDLDRINASIRSGFNFIIALSRAEHQLAMLSAHDMGPMNEGLNAISRANIVHYERGHLQEGVKTFESLLSVIEQQKCHLEIYDSRVPEELRTLMAATSGADSTTFSVVATLRALAEACIKMHPAHEYAARVLHWSRATGFDGEGGSKPMQAGWSAVLEQARACSAASQPLKWKHLCEFMRLYFEGLSYTTAHSEALCTGTAAKFVIDNLRDGVLMIRHQCKQLEASSEALRNAEAACQASLRASNTINPKNPVYDGLDGPPMRSIRQQLVTMQRWLVQMHGVYFRLDRIVRYSIAADPTTTCMHRFHIYHTALAHVNSLLQSFTVVYHRSTLLDLFEKTMKHSRFLDYFVYRDLCGEQIRSLQEHIMPETQNGQMVLELKDDVPGYLKWFMTARERSLLAVRFGVMCQLIGFDLENAEIAKTKREIRDGTHSGRFCVFAIDMIELLRQMGAQSMPLDIVAELTVSVKRDAGTMAPGVDSSERRARRSPEVQKFARRVCQLVESIRARFPPADLATLCDKRRQHVGALEAIFERMVKSLHTAAPAAGMAGETGADGYAMLRFETINHLGELMPDFTPQDMHDLNLHAIALAELANDINIRMQAVFGGNFPALVWLNDCYEFDPAHAHKDMALLRDNERVLFEAVLVIQVMFEKGHLTSQPIEIAATTAALDVTDVVKAAVSTPREPSSARSGKKKKGKR